MKNVKKSFSSRLHEQFESILRILITYTSLDRLVRWKQKKSKFLSFVCNRQRKCIDAFNFLKYKPTCAMMLLSSK